MDISVLIFLTSGLFLGWALGAKDAANVATDERDAVCVAEGVDILGLRQGNLGAHDDLAARERKGGFRVGREKMAAFCW